MNSHLSAYILTCCALAGVAFFSSPGDVRAQEMAATDVRGSWLGTLAVPGGELRIVFHIEGSGDSLTATLDSPDQSAMGFPTSGVTLEGDSLEIAVAAAGGVYRGEVGSDVRRIEGTWTQSGQSFPLVLERTDKVPAPKEPPKRPQEPQPPFPYSSEDVTFPNETDGIELAGTLTLPDTTDVHPAVVLISGSGPQDRDATVVGHRLFLVLADHLTRQGIAVLRFDERGVGASTGDFAQATTEDFARDAEAAVAYLQGHPEIDADQIGFVGHSEGGLIAPMVAARSDEVAFLVLLAAPGVTGEEILYAQKALIARAQGISDSLIQADRALHEKLFAALKQDADSTQIAQDVRRILEEAGMSGETAEAQVAQAMSPWPWLRFFLTYDPAPALEKVDVPVLALFGENDLQVPAETNRAAIEAALERGGNEAFTTDVLDDLNHLFQTSETGAPSEYARIEETMAPAALETIAAWIREQVGAAGR